MQAKIGIREHYNIILCNPFVCIKDPTCNKRNFLLQREKDGRTFIHTIIKEWKFSNHQEKAGVEDLGLEEKLKTVEENLNDKMSVYLKIKEIQGVW